MDLYRFFVLDLTGIEAILPDDQAHHARHVLRLETGAQVVAFDGNGSWALGKLRVEKRAVTVSLGQLQQDPPPRLQLTLATAVPKTDRAEWLVEQASQLGVACVQWLETDRGVVKLKDAGKIDKLRRVAVESAKQCGRTHLMAIAPMQTLDQLLAEKFDAVLWLEPRAGKPAGELKIPAAGNVLALIGPEGGWSPRELNLLEARPDILRLRLTPTILRIETACAAVAALLLAR